MGDFFLETYASRQSETGQNASIKLMALFGYSDDERFVRQYVLANTEPYFEGVLPRLRTRQDPIGGDLWRVEIDYGVGTKLTEKNPKKGGEGGDHGDDQAGKNDPLPLELTVSGGSATLHITQSLRTVASAKKTADARLLPNHKGAIGVSKEGVAGCDIPIPAMEWTENWTWKAAYVTWGYLKQLSDLQGRYNKNTFRTFAGGEVTFLTWDSPPQGTDLRKISYKFRREKNATDETSSGGSDNRVKLTPEFDPIAKLGAQYLWVEYEEDKNADALLKVPRAVYVEEVGRPGLFDGGNPSNAFDFGDPINGLGIGK